MQKKEDACFELLYEVRRDKRVTKWKIENLAEELRELEKMETKLRSELEELGYSSLDGVINAI